MTTLRQAATDPMQYDLPGTDWSLEGNGDLRSMTDIVRSVGRFETVAAANDFQLVSQTPVTATPEYIAVDASREYYRHRPLFQMLLFERVA